MSSTFTFSFPIIPAALQNSKATPFETQIDGAASVAAPFRTHMAAQSVPGVADAIKLEYKWHLLLVGGVLRLDTADANLRALRPLRGRFEEAWLQTALKVLESHGLFSRSYSSLEELILKAISTIGGASVFPPGLILNSSGYVEDLSWAPGQLGAAASQPWVCDFTFGDYIDSQGADSRALFQFLFECTPEQTRTDVISTETLQRDLTRR